MSASARGGSRPLKEAVFIQVRTPDENYIFFDETDSLGRKMKYDRPEATCSMRATTSAVVFSLLKFSNRTRAAAVEKRLELPRGVLDRAERRAEALSKDLPENYIAVEIEDQVFPLTIKRDENGVTTLETPEGVDDAVIELPKRALRLTIVLRSPRGKKVVAGCFEGHLGKPEDKETVVRLAAFALNLLSGLPAFRLVAGVETVNVPPSPARYAAVRPTRKAADQVRVTVPVRLWTGDENPQPVAQTLVEVRVDLDTANPVSGRLLFHITPDPAAAEVFEAYRTVTSEAALALVSQYLGPDEVTDLVYSIALGELGEGDLERLRSALATVTGLDLNPKQWVVFNPAA